jgi:hypothetical protein
MTTMAMCSLGVLILSARIEPRMVVLWLKFKVINPVVSLVMVFMVNIEVLGDHTVFLFPHIPMEQCSASVRPSVIPIIAERVFSPVEDHKGERFGSASERESPPLKNSVDTLSATSKSGCNFLQAVAFLVKLIHRSCLLVVTVKCHDDLLSLIFNRYLTQGLSNVNALFVVIFGSVWWRFGHATPPWIRVQGVCRI